MHAYASRMAHNVDTFEGGPSHDGSVHLMENVHEILGRETEKQHGLLEGNHLETSLFTEPSNKISNDC